MRWVTPVRPPRRGQGTRTCQTAAMRTTPRIASAALIGAVALLVGCTSASNDTATQPTTLAVNTSGTNQSTVPIVTVGTTAPTGATAPPATAVPPTTVAPTSTIVPAGTSVTITRGAFITKTKGSCTPTTCKYVQITSSGWEPNQSLAVTCFSSSGSSGPYAKNADSTGTLNAGTVCFFGNATGVYVSINGVNSNIVTPWKDW